jgi:hypothetical protein
MAGDQFWTPRRQFRLPRPDEEFLDAMGLPWETVAIENARRLLVYGFPVPRGYGRDVVDLFLRLDPGYPDVQIDMVYFHPALAKVDGDTIAALSTERFDDKTWQRWSRHRTRANPWRPGLDTVETHLALVQEWLRREIAR